MQLFFNLGGVYVTRETFGAPTLSNVRLRRGQTFMGSLTKPVAWYETTSDIGIQLMF